MTYVVKKPTKSVSAQSLSTEETKKHGLRERYAQVAYYYPQYTLHQVEDMASRDIDLLLRTAAEQLRLDKLRMRAAIIEAFSGGGKK